MLHCVSCSDNTCRSIFADWAEDAFKEVFNAPQKQQQSEFAVDGGVDVEVGNEAVEVAVDIEVDTPEGVWFHNSCVNTLQLFPHC